MSAINVTAPLETASERERFQFYRTVAARLQRTEETAVSTSDATPTRVWSLLMPEDSVITLHGSVIALRADGTEAAGYFRWVTFRRVGSGAAAQLGSIGTITGESDTSWDVAFAAGSPTGTVELLVTGDAATDIDWEAAVTFKVKVM